MSLKCTMILGDCLEVLPTLSAASTHFVFADFPYGRGLNCQWDRKGLAESALPIIRNLRTQAGVIAVTAVQPFTTLHMCLLKDMYKHALVWNKVVHGSPGVARFRPLLVHEDVLIFGTPRSTYNPQMVLSPKLRTIGGNKCASGSAPIKHHKPEYIGKKYTDKYPTSIVTASSRFKLRGLHPTQKPVMLLDWLIRTYSNPGDAVLDPVSGSGTTAASALQNGRHCVAIERDPTYFDASVERIRKHATDNKIDATIEVRR